MDALAGYGSSDDESTAQAPAPAPAAAASAAGSASASGTSAAASGLGVNLAPEVDISVRLERTIPRAEERTGVPLTARIRPGLLVRAALRARRRQTLNPVVPYTATNGMVIYNPTVEAMYAPELGPQRPNQLSAVKRNNLAGTRARLFRPVGGVGGALTVAGASARACPAPGHVELDAMNELQFEEQRRTFHTYGYALDPSASAVGERRFIGNVDAAAANKGATIFHDVLPSSNERKKRKAKGDAALDPFSYEGPWAGYEGEKIHLVNEAAQVRRQAPVAEARRWDHGG